MIAGFKHISIHPLLKGYVEKLWIFESDGKPLSVDLKLIVPNDRLKIAFPYKNSIIAEVEGTAHTTAEHSITLTGMMDIPFRMDMAEPGISGTICAELSAHGAYCFFNMDLSTVRNTVISVSELKGQLVKAVEAQMADQPALSKKIEIFQGFLLHEFAGRREDKIFEYSVQRIKAARGDISISTLEKATGYSSRWLNIKFKEKLGLSPKTFASIIRFKQFYEGLGSAEPRRRYSPNFYQSYYDQSHFVKNFRRFTGMPPSVFQKQLNNWGRLFYSA